MQPINLSPESEEVTANQVLRQEHVLLVYIKGLCGVNEWKIVKFSKAPNK